MSFILAIFLGLCLEAISKELKIKRKRNIVMVFSSGGGTMISTRGSDGECNTLPTATIIKSSIFSTCYTLKSTN